MGATIAPLSIAALRLPEAALLRLHAAPVEPVHPVEPARAEHAASTVAFSPTAMAVLIEAQEYVSAGAQASDRAASVRKIDSVMAHLAAPPTDTAPMSLRMLDIVRKQLRSDTTLPTQHLRV